MKTNSKIEAFKLRNPAAAANKKRSKVIAHKGDRRKGDARKSWTNEQF